MERKQVMASGEEDFIMRKPCKSAGADCCHGQQGTASLLPHCMICGEIPENGIMGGIFVQRQFLCDDCEQAIVALDGDAVPYEEYLAMAEKLKKIIS